MSRRYAKWILVSPCHEDPPPKTRGLVIAGLGFFGIRMTGFRCMPEWLSQDPGFISPMPQIYMEAYTK
ncbi:hypothetical protein MHI43_02965 [Paenibacillus sp. FSL H8-0457]|uniref:hypothetical protein n=1 Tax=Paenibacillus sp. FSL H8-0457 TaxID=2921386 RepID=UPI0003118421